GGGVRASRERLSEGICAARSLSRVCEALPGRELGVKTSPATSSRRPVVRLCSSARQRRVYSRTLPTACLLEDFAALGLAVLLGREDPALALALVGAGAAGRRAAALALALAVVHAAAAHLGRSLLVVLLRGLVSRERGGAKQHGGDQSRLVHGAFA